MRRKQLGILLLIAVLSINSIVYADSLKHGEPKITDVSREAVETEKNQLRECNGWIGQDKGKVLEATRSQASSSEAILPQATPSEATLPQASPSEATPSQPSVLNGVPVEEVEFEAANPEDVPSWYSKIKGRIFRGKTHYQFEDRYGTVQHRIYGYYDGEASPEWYECDEKGRVTNESKWIDLLWEDMILAPLRWENGEVETKTIEELSCQLYGMDDYISKNMDFEITNPELGKNYDGTFYDIWQLGDDVQKPDSSPRYFLYGHAVNGDVENRWLECTESGMIIERSYQLKPTTVPSWYVKSSNGAMDYYFFLDRNGTAQYRKYTVVNSILGWYACDSLGGLSGSTPIDIQREDVSLAPYRYQNAEITDGGLGPFLYGNQGEMLKRGEITADVLPAYNYDGTQYDYLCIHKVQADGPVPSGYYMYGSIVNSGVESGHPGNRWYKCNEQGDVHGAALYVEGQEPAMEFLSPNSGMDVGAVEKTLSGWNTKVLAASSIPKGGRLMIDCDLAKKYGNKVAINDYLGSSNDRHRVIVLYRADQAWTNLRRYSEMWSEGSKWVYAPIDEESYWYAASKVDFASHWEWTISEVNNGGYYYDSESDGKKWATIDMKDNYFTMVRRHTYGGWAPTSPATCTGAGGRTRTCTGCGHVETETIPALGHAWEADYYTGADNGTYFKRCRHSGCTAKTDVRNNPYTVSFHANGGEGGVASQNFIYSVPEQLDENRFRKDYHTFRHWSTGPDGNGGTYNDRASVRNLTPVHSGSVNLYAQWKPNEYDITYDDGLDGCQSITESHVYTTKLGKLPVFLRQGYTLFGFYTSQSGGQKVTEDTYTPHSDTTYYARWKPNTYDLVFNWKDSSCGSGKETVTFDSPIGILPIPTLEDFRFLGWYAQPYSGLYPEGIMWGDREPPNEKGIKASDIYQTPGDTQSYAYFTLVYRNLGDGRNQRPGMDGFMDTDDDNYYLNGKDGIAGSHDDYKIHPGLDNRYGTEDDYYKDENGLKTHPGSDETFGNGDDYRDNGDGTNTRPGPDHEFGTDDDLLASNGLDETPGTRADWVDNSNDYPDTNLRPGGDGILGTGDDEVYWNGPDGVPGTVDDRLIHPGLDGGLGTMDDWVYHSHDYPATNLRPGRDGTLGTGDDEVYWNGPDGLPGTEDDMLILPGQDGQHGTGDDCFDNGDEKEGTNVRPGQDGIFGTKDDELWLNGLDGIPGTEDDRKYIPPSSNGSSSGNRQFGRGAYKPLLELAEEAVSGIAEPQPYGVICTISNGQTQYKRPGERRTEGIRIEPVQKKEETVRIEWDHEGEPAENRRKNQEHQKEDSHASIIKPGIILLFILCTSGYIIRKVYKRKK